MGNMACTYDEMVLEGKAIRIREPGDAIGLGIAMLSEDRKVNGFVPSLDVAKNISLARLDKVSDKGLMKKNVENEFGRQYIKKLNIKVRDEHDNVNNLSGGNQQKVVLPSVKQATAAGIPVFCTSNLPESDEDYITCIGTENFAYGQTAIDMIAEAAGGKANILVMVGALTTTNQAEMLQGIVTASTRSIPTSRSWTLLLRPSTTSLPATSGLPWLRTSSSAAMSPSVWLTSTTPPAAPQSSPSMWTPARF